MKECRLRVSRNEAVNAVFYQMDLSGPGFADALPGQFVNIKIDMEDGPLLRRPFSIYRADAEGISILYKVVGRGTGLLSEAPLAREFSVIGPLGNGFPLPEKVAPDAPVLLIGGGIGIPPLAFMASYLARQKDGSGQSLYSSVAILGFQTADHVYEAPELSATKQIIIATDDGSQGVAGNVLDALKNAAISKALCGYACGPEPMLRAVQQYALDNKRRFHLSLEAFMGCGFGVCLSCAVPHKKGTYVRACSEGPVFAADELDW